MHFETIPTNAANFIDLTGKTFGRLTVAGYGGKGFWWCKCNCGTAKRINGASLRGGRTESCGCHHREISKKIHITHGRSESALYRIWEGIKSRCLNPKCEAYPKYGGRGITMWTPWVSSFEAFALYVGERPSKRHSLDRMDNDGNYEPGNVKWSTSVEQNNNRRDNKSLTIEGKTRTYAEWCRELGVNYKTFHTRVTRGRTPEEALGL